MFNKMLSNQANTIHKKEKISFVCYHKEFWLEKCVRLWNVASFKGKVNWLFFSSNSLFLLPMSSLIYLINRFPYCHVSVTRSKTLRDHLENSHTLKCNFTSERRKGTKEITFVTEPGPNSRTCFGCCFCKMFFDDEAVFKKHIENDHVITTVIHSHNRRTYSYDIKNVNASTATIEAEAKWIIGDILVSDLLHSFRDQVVIRHNKGQPLSDIDLLMSTKALLFLQMISIKR
ncbi:hypothetical protein EDC96DRAFT_525422 [Choanephora cucurbitarum]|nr:hypothetical protein EDC96DRAFT_525422 [Choanephora cucurbitarum]